MQQMYSCPNCGSQIAYGQSACVNCGVTLDWEGQQTWEQQMYACPNCRAQVVSGQSACSNCGLTLDWVGQQAPPSNQPPPCQQLSDWEEPHKHHQQNIRSKTIAALKKKLPSDIITPVIIFIVVLLVGGGIAFAVTGDLFAPSSCNPPDLTATSTPPADKIPPAVTSFTASPSVIPAGENATLSWEVSRATSVSIDNGVGTVSSSGTIEVSPATTTTYTLTAANSSGSATGSATVTVNLAIIPVITSFTASPSTITVGQRSTLQWNVSGATSVSIDQDIAATSTSGSEDVSPSKTTTYTLTATNSNGTATKQATVTVAATGAPVITSFKASPSTIGVSQNSTLQWNVTGVTSVSIDQGIGIVYPSGTKEVSPNTTTTYTLTARNSNGTATASAKVTVAGPAVPVVTFTANPRTIFAGESSLLEWDVSGATSVSINQDIGTVLSLGSLVKSPATTTIYTLTATNSYGTETRQVTVSVHPAVPPEIISFTTEAGETATTISAGQPLTLIWTIEGVVELASIDHSVGNVTGQQVEVQPTETTTYTLRASNKFGEVSREVTVNVP